MRTNLKRQLTHRDRAHGGVERGKRTHLYCMQALPAHGGIPTRVSENRGLTEYGGQAHGPQRLEPGALLSLVPMRFSNPGLLVPQSSLHEDLHCAY